jgi:hypothetical protein
LEIHLSPCALTFLLPLSFSQTQAVVDKKKKELDEITKNVFAEFQTFVEEKREQLKSIVSQFITQQIEHLKKEHAQWEAALQEIAKL